MEMNEVLLTYNEYITRLPKGCTIISNYLREDDIHKSMLGIQEFSEGVMWLIKANEILKEAGIHEQLNIKKIQQYLVEINDGLQRQDFVLVGDLFEYEIVPFFEEISESYTND
ncbi:hypothetical protein [Solibacillus sp. FSL W7-1324]|uniref:hypothetical protein n=1 Tax=Solibacillus sp. FSL W7-1324 TaxID=2921701 RepID=UPI0030FADAD4